MKDRLLQLMQLEQLSPAKFADILGIQRSGLSHILSGRNKPGYEFISKLLLKFTTVSAEWLITGKGKMYKQELVQEQHIDRKKENSRDLFSSQIYEPQKVENQLRENSIKIENKPISNEISLITITLAEQKKECAEKDGQNSWDFKNDVFKCIKK